MTTPVPVLAALTEDELDMLVSIAIRRAEILDETQSPGAAEAWTEVMVYEERLTALTRPEEMPGGVARVGAVTAALAAGRRSDAARLAARYLAEEGFPSERQEAVRRAFQEDEERLARRFPALAKSGRLAELADWRASTSAFEAHVFPRAA
jgi:hypothetical protein